MTDKKTGLPQSESAPKLEMAVKEIDEILKKYDIAGLVVVHTVGFKKVFVKLNPSYSCVEVNDLSRFKINKPIEEPAEPEKAARKIADTVNMLTHLTGTTVQLTGLLNQCLSATRIAFGMMPPPGPPKIIPPSNGKKR